MLQNGICVNDHETDTRHIFSISETLCQNKTFEKAWHTVKHPKGFIQPFDQHRSRCELCHKRKIAYEINQLRTPHSNHIHHIIHLQFFLSSTFPTIAAHNIQMLIIYYSLYEKS